VVHIKGCVIIIFSARNDEHRTFTDIYFIRKLKTNILIIGQLNKITYEIFIKSSVMCIKDEERRVLAKIPHTPNQLYVLYANIVQPVCYLACAEEGSWRWHAQLGHLNF
jgi:hypothetical protein